MKTINMTLAAGLVALLTACGGGGSSGGSSSGGGGSTATNTQSTGILRDSAVDGVDYKTSTGNEGTTSNGGKFQYKMGETVTFILGSLELRYTPTEASEEVTPTQLAEQLATDLGLTPEKKENVLNNLLVLFQSLDEDGDATKDGIKIATAKAITLTPNDLTTEPALFAANSAFTEAVPLTGRVVPLTEAQAHFEAENKKAEIRSLAGMYYADDLEGLDGIALALRIDSNGAYIVGELIVEDGGDDVPGIERGQISTWDPASGKITFDKPDFRYGTAGFVGENMTFTLSKDKNSLTFNDGEEDTPFKRMTQGTGNSIVGTWAVATTPIGQNQREPISNAKTSLNTQLFSFFADGTYVMLDPVGNDEGAFDTPPDTCGMQGVEAGKYNFTNGKITFSDMIVDTNDCAGMHGDDGYDEPISAEISCNTMTWDLGYNIPFVLERIDGNEDCIATDGVSLKDLAGIYIPTPDDIIKDGYFTVLRINSDGGYTIGEFDGKNGIERGTLQYNASTKEYIYANEDLRTLPETDLGLGLRSAKISLTSKNQITITNDEDTFRLNRFEQGLGNNIVGAWATTHNPISSPETSLETEQFIFFADGTYVMFDPTVDTNPPYCGQPGVEAGKYTLDAGQMTLSNNIADTNGCGGLHNGYYKRIISFQVDENTMTWNTDDGELDQFKLKRISTLVE